MLIDIHCILVCNIFKTIDVDFFKFRFNESWMNAFFLCKVNQKDDIIKLVAF